MKWILAIVAILVTVWIVEAAPKIGSLLLIILVLGMLSRWVTKPKDGGSGGSWA